MRANEQATRIEQYFDRLWPLCRSILGPEYRASLEILSEVMPHEKLEFKTGEKILDWTVPEEWVAEDSYLIDPNGIKRAEFKKNNLHLLNYSTAFEGTFSYAELKPHLYTLENQPTAIPYVTSYYKKRWGLCLSYEEYKTLPDGQYHVNIKTQFKPGKMVIAEATLPGESKEEILFTSYLCHPSLANNELSGPLALVFLYDRLKQWPRRKYTYRFAVFPETIGSIGLLSKRGEHFQKWLRAGYVLTCIGDAGALTYKHSRKENTLADKIALSVLNKTSGFKSVRFNPAIGSDERQFCSPGFNLPVGSVMRTMYTDYPEYHTSLDNKSLMDFEKMSETTFYLEKMAQAFEQNSLWLNQFPYGEPQLGPRGVFRTLSDKVREEEEMALWWVLNFSDGQNDLLSISERSGFSLEVLSKVAHRLAEHGLVKEKI